MGRSVHSIAFGFAAMCLASSAAPGASATSGADPRPAFPVYTQVPRSFTLRPAVWGDLLERARDETVRICILGDSQETCSSGFGATYIPSLNYRFWQVYGNCPETPFISHTSVAGNGRWPWSGWLWGTIEGTDFAEDSPLPTSLFPPFVTARLILDTAPSLSGWTYMLLHDGINGQDTYDPSDVDYFDTSGDVRAEFVAATAPGSGALRWRARPTNFIPHHSAPVTSSGVLSLDLDRPGPPQIVTGLTRPLDFAGKTYMTLEQLGSSATAPTTVLGARFRNMERCEGLVVQSFSDGGLTTAAVVADHGDMGPFLAALEFDAFIVHLGVNDAFSAHTAQTYKENVLEVMQLVRTACGDPELPFIIAIDVHRADGPPAMQFEFDRLAGAAYEIALADPFVALLNLRRMTEEDLAWGPDNEGFLLDGVHLTVESQRELARMAVDGIFGIGGVATCPDVDGDGNVGVTDLVGVVLAWGSSDYRADVNGDAIVDVLDLVDVILAWGACP